MKRITKSSDTTIFPEERPAANAEARERQLIALATDRAEEQLRKGTASSQVITHYLKLGTANAELEREKLKYEIELLKTKKESIEKQQASDVMYSKVLTALREYSGEGAENDQDIYGAD